MQLPSRVSPHFISVYNVHDGCSFHFIKWIFIKHLHYTFLQGVLGNVDFAKGVDNLSEQENL
jgi:hypothetical protein